MVKNDIKDKKRTMNKLVKYNFDKHKSYNWYPTRGLQRNRNQ